MLGVWREVCPSDAPCGSVTEPSLRAKLRHSERLTVASQNQLRSGMAPSFIGISEKLYPHLQVHQISLPLLAE